MQTTLALAVTDLEAEVGNFLGWGDGAAFGDEAWDDRQKRQILRSVRSGLEWVYKPTMPDPNAPVHRWSFLQPVATVTLDSGARYAKLPEDLGGIEGDITLSQSTAGGFWPIRLVGEPMVRDQFARFPNSTGRPTMAALDTLHDSTAERASTARLYVFPEADGAYVLRFTYYLLPDYLTAAHPYPYGGAAHAETFRAAVRAAAELYVNNVQNGPELANFVRRLAASIAQDRKMKPQSLGYNADRSDGYSQWNRPWPWLLPATTTFNGADPNL